MVVEMVGACIIRSGKVSRRVISCLCRDGAVASMGSIRTGRVGTGMLCLSGEGSWVGFLEVRGDIVDGVSIEMNEI